MIEQIVREITDLTDEWYVLIGGEHHKDRDCHWYIETKWSYGYAPVYTVQHHGYIIHNFEEIECISYEEALIHLRDLLKKYIDQEKEQQKANFDQEELDYQ